MGRRAYRGFLAQFFQPHYDTIMRLALVVAFTLCAATAAAQPKENKAESDKSFFEGVKLFEAKDYAAARVKFADAYSKFPSPNSLLNMASTELILGQYIDALAHFRAYLALPENPRITSDKKEMAHQGITSCTANVGRLNVKAPAGTTVSIDGVAVKWLEGDAIDVLPGTHVVDLRHGDDTRTRKVDSVAGAVGFVQWEDPVVTPPPVVSPLDLTHPGDAPPIMGRTGSTERPLNNQPKWIAGGALAGVGVVGLVLSGVFYGMNQSAKSDLESKSTPGACNNMQSASCLDLGSARDRQDTFRAASLGALVVGAAFSAAGAGVLIWAVVSHKPMSPAARSRGVLPYYAGTSVGLLGEF